MYSSVRREIPEFLAEQVVYCDNLVERRGDKSCLLLLHNLHFYEFQQKQLRRSINLSSTCLALMEERLKMYKGPKGKWFECHCSTDEITGDQSILTDTTNTTISQKLETTPEIVFGKYVYTNLGIRKLYIILRCWDKLLVLQRMEDDYKIAREFEHVIRHRLVHGKVKYQAVVEIEFNTGATICTDFQDPNEKAECNSSTKCDFGTQDKGDFKKLLERVRITQAELQVHKAITQKQMDQIRSTQAFGCPFLRSFKMEEKQMLACCGDIWLRITTGDALVIGVPLVNNFTPPNLTVIKNLKPVLQLNSSNSLGLNYHHRLYQLQSRFEDLDSMQTFFESEDAKLQATSWTSDNQQQLLPDTFAVLLIQIRISDLVTMTKCPLLLFFEIEKDLELGEPKVQKTRTFEQQIFLKNLDFHRVLSNRFAYDISFKESTLHQDFLAIAFTSIEIKLRMQFSTLQDQIIFERLLVSSFNFELIQKIDRNSASIDAMEVDTQEQKPSSLANSSHVLFYNKNPSSLWHGFLALKEAQKADAEADELKVVWKFFTKNEEKAFLLLKLLFNDMLLNQCNILYVYLEHNDRDVKLVEFENAMRQELQARLVLLNNRPNKRELSACYIQLLEFEAKTDVSAALKKGMDIP